MVQKGLIMCGMWYEVHGHGQRDRWWTKWSTQAGVHACPVVLVSKACRMSPRPSWMLTELEQSLAGLLSLRCLWWPQLAKCLRHNWRALGTGSKFQTRESQLSTVILYQPYFIDNILIYCYDLIIVFPYWGHHVKKYNLIYFTSALIS